MKSRVQFDAYDWLAADGYMGVEISWSQLNFVVPTCSTSSAMRATALSPAVAVVLYVRAPEPQFRVPPSSCAPNHKGIEGSVLTESIEQDKDQAQVGIHGI